MANRDNKTIVPPVLHVDVDAVSCHLLLPPARYGEISPTPSLSPNIHRSIGFAARWKVAG